MNKTCDGLISHIDKLFANVAKGIVDGAKWIGGKIVDGVIKLGEIIVDGLTWVWDATKSVLTLVWNGIEWALDVAASCVKLVWKGIKYSFKMVVGAALVGTCAFLRCVYCVVSHIWKGIKWVARVAKGLLKGTAVLMLELATGPAICCLELSGILKPGFAYYPSNVGEDSSNGLGPDGLNAEEAAGGNAGCGSGIAGAIYRKFGRGETLDGDEYEEGG